LGTAGTRVRHHAGIALLSFVPLLVKALPTGQRSFAATSSDRAEIRAQREQRLQVDHDASVVSIGRLRANGPLKLIPQVSII
jgi:hypothetical protein